MSWFFRWPCLSILQPTEDVERQRLEAAAVERERLQEVLFKCIPWGPCFTTLKEQFYSNFLTIYSKSIPNIYRHIKIYTQIYLNMFMFIYFGLIYVVFSFLFALFCMFFCILFCLFVFLVLFLFFLRFRFFGLFGAHVDNLSGRCEAAAPNNPCGMFAFV